MNDRSVISLLAGQLSIFIGMVVLAIDLPMAFAQFPIVHAIFPSADAEVPIKSWQSVGPFFFDKRELATANAKTLPVGFGRDYLRNFGFSEQSVDATEFLEATREKSKLGVDVRFGNRVIHANPENNILQLSVADDSLNYAVGYVATIIESPQDQEIAIAAGVDDNMRLWLNHELLFADRNDSYHGLSKFQRIIGAKLKKGNNFLLVKVGNLEDDWELIVTMYRHKRALELARDNAVNPILVSSVVTTGEELELRNDLLPPQSPVEYRIFDSFHKLVESAISDYHGRGLKHNLRGLKANRLYFCTVSVDGRRIERPFYYGDLDAAYTRFSHEVDMFAEASDFVRVDLHAQLARLRHLLLPVNRRSEFWDQKVVASIAEVQANLAAMRKGDATFRHAPGTHLRGYRATVDDQVQHYWIHIPSKALHAGNPLPLVIVLPYIAGKRPFLESYFLAAFDETESYKILGDEYGFAVLQVWARGDYMGGTALATSDIFDALNAVRRDYRIDSNRIYLLGYCEGGRQALLLAERFPGRFAAVATEGPTTDMHIDSPWSRYSSPINAIENLLDTPIFITHDEADTTPFQDSVTFSSRCQKAGVKITLIRRHGDGGDHGFDQNPMAVKRSLFAFFQAKRLIAQHSKTVPANPAESRFGVGRGPIEDAFGSPALIVEGTLGTADEHAVVHAVVNELCSEWREAYFVDCPIKRDVDSTDADIQNYNLVIVGDGGTNSVIKRISDRLPVRSSLGHLSLAGKTYNGAQLGYEFIARNPLNTRKYVVIIGMNRWLPIKGWELYPTRDGVYDYIVFDLHGTSSRVEDEGYFETF